MWPLKSYLRLKTPADRSYGNGPQKKELETHKQKTSEGGQKAADSQPYLKPDCHETMRVAMAT